MVVNTVLATLSAAASICEQGKFSSPRTDSLGKGCPILPHVVNWGVFLDQVSLTSRLQIKKVSHSVT